MGSKHFRWELQDILPKLEETWQNYIDYYFEGNEELWHKKSEPYIFYKHLFRKFAYTKCKYKKDVQQIEKKNNR